MTTLEERSAKLAMKANGEHKWTLEHGRGQTYNTGKPTLYFHDEYPNYSVMAGCPRRHYVTEFSDLESAKETLEAIGLEYTDMMDSYGTTHVDVNDATRHLPDDAG